MNPPRSPHRTSWGLSFVKKWLTSRLALYTIALRVIGRMGLIFEMLSIEIATRFDNAVPLIALATWGDLPRSKKVVVLAHFLRSSSDE